MSATTRVKFTVNGRPVELAIEPREMLLDVVRDRLGLTGAKRSCDLQVCGACTLLLDGVPVSACCTLAYEANGRAIETIEGLAARGELHPIQSAFIDKAALQCGFCTSGMILATKALLAENAHPTEPEIKHYLAGNICRCTGYWNIVEAVEEAARRLNGAGTALTPSPSPNLGRGEHEGCLTANTKIAAARDPSVAGMTESGCHRPLLRSAQDDGQGSDERGDGELFSHPPSFHPPNFRHPGNGWTSCLSNLPSGHDDGRREHGTSPLPRLGEGPGVRALPQAGEAAR